MQQFNNSPDHGVGEVLPPCHDFLRQLLHVAQHSFEFGVGSLESRLLGVEVRNGLGMLFLKVVNGLLMPAPVRLRIIFCRPLGPLEFPQDDPGVVPFRPLLIGELAIPCQDRIELFADVAAVGSQRLLLGLHPPVCPRGVVGVQEPGELRLERLRVVVGGAV
jgi:hypothetical protein